MSTISKFITMKRLFKLSSFIPVFLLLISASGKISYNGELCNKVTKQKVKKELNPYNYSSMKTMSVFTSDKQDYNKEIMVPLFSGEKYRFVFSIEGINEDLDIEIFDKPKGEKRRKLVYSTESVGAGQSIYLFQPKKSQPLYVNFHFKKSETIKEGCVMMMLGYKFN